MKKSIVKRIGIGLLWFFGIITLLGIINFAPMLSLKTPGMKTYVVDGITVYAKPQDEVYASRIAARIGESRDRVTAALGHSNAEGIDVIVYPSRGALKRNTIGLAGHLLLPNWLIGRNNSNTVLIASPADPGPEHTGESVIQAAVHEYVHVLTDRLYKTMGYWLKEGFALYLAEQKPEVENIRVHRDISYREYANPNALQFAEVGGYALAYTMMEYMEKTYGWEQILGFLTPGAGFEDVTGETEEEFFTSWKKWLETI